MPSPTCLNGLRGHVTGIYTEPHARGRGHERAILRELLGWLQRHGMAVAELHASAQGAPLMQAGGEGRAVKPKTPAVVAAIDRSSIPA